jgi:hypothetical protein
MQDSKTLQIQDLRNYPPGTTIKLSGYMTSLYPSEIYSWDYIGSDDEREREGFQNITITYYFYKKRSDEEATSLREANLERRRQEGRRQEGRRRPETLEEQQEAKDKFRRDILEQQTQLGTIITKSEYDKYVKGEKSREQSWVVYKPYLSLGRKANALYIKVDPFLHSRAGEIKYLVNAPAGKIIKESEFLLLPENEKKKWN